MPDFLPGLQLSRAFFQEVVRPILQREFPSLRYSAALLGSGSEVLGYDTPLSRDHDWGPRLQLFVEDSVSAPEIRGVLADQLPATYRGYATTFPAAEPASSEGGEHRVEVLTLGALVWDQLRFDVDREIEPADWLTFPEQKLLALTAGEVFHDEAGLEALRARFAYYPHDVWLYLLAAGWTRVGQEEHLMGRAGSVGDEIGSALIGARLVRDLMRLAFLMEKRYAPYPKWFGTAFARLPCAADLTPPLRQALQAQTWQEREAHLVAAYEAVAAMHNRLGITRPLPATAHPFFNRPFRVIHLEGRFAEEIAACIRDPVVQRLAEGRRIGSIDQFSDSTDLVTEPAWRGTLRQLFE